MRLPAYAGADEFKRGCGMERVTLAAQRRTVAVSNCCTVTNPDPPCTERSVRGWTASSLPDPGRDRASVIMCIFHVGFRRTQGETFSRSTKALRDVQSLLFFLVIVIIIINEACTDPVLWLHLHHAAHWSCHSLLIAHLSLHSQFSPSL